MSEVIKSAPAIEAIEDLIEDSSTETLDRTEYEISYGTGKYCKDANPQPITWGDLAVILTEDPQPFANKEAKDEQEWFINAIFDGGGRKKADLNRLTQIIAVECDGVGLPPKEAADIIGALGISFVLYTSFSHSFEKPKYRIFFLLDRPIKDTTEHQKIVNGLQVYLSDLGTEIELPQECWRPTNLWYFGRVWEPFADQFFSGYKDDGTPLSIDMLIDKGKDFQRPDGASRGHSRIDHSKAIDLDTLFRNQHPVIMALAEKNMILGDLHLGSTGGWQYTIQCPWETEHSTPGGTGTVYRPMNGIEGHEIEWFHCSHSTCQSAGRSSSVAQFIAAIDPNNNGLLDRARKWPIKWLQNRYVVVGGSYVVDIVRLKMREHPSNCIKKKIDFIGHYSGLWVKGDPNANPPIPDKLATKAFFSSSVTKRCFNKVFEPQGTGFHNGDYNPIGFWSWPETNTEPLAFLDLVEHLIPDPIEREYVLDWCAFAIQKRGTIQCALLFVSPAFGVGKNSLFKMLQGALGHYSVMMEFNKLTSADRKFNASAAEMLLLYCPEIKPDSIKAQRESNYVYHHLKQLIEPGKPAAVMLEDKNVSERAGKQHFNLLMASNYTVPFSIPEEDRRISVVSATENKDIPKERWDFWINAAEDPEHAAALWHWAHRRDLTGYKSYEPLVSRAKDEMIGCSGNIESDVPGPLLEVFESFEGEWTHRSQLISRGLDEKFAGLTKKLHHITPKGWHSHREKSIMGENVTPVFCGHKSRLKVYRDLLNPDGTPSPLLKKMVRAEINKNDIKNSPTFNEEITSRGGRGAKKGDAKF